MDAVAATINIPPAIPAAAFNGGSALTGSAFKGASAAAQATAFRSAVQFLLGATEDQDQPQSSGPDLPARDLPLADSPEIAGLAPASQLADAMIRSMFTSASNVALVNSAATNPATGSKAATLHSPFLRSSGSPTNFASKLPGYASVIPAAAKPGVAAPLAFGLRVTPINDPPTQHETPATQDASESANAPAAPVAEHDVAEEAAPAAEAVAEQSTALSQPALATETASDPASDSKTPRPAQARDDNQSGFSAQPRDNAVTAVASAGAFSGGGNSDSTGDLARQMSAEIASATTAPAIGKIQNLAAPSVTDALRAAAPSAPVSSTQATSPLREIAVRISAPQAPAVDVHLAERAGQLHVAVRTADGGLQTSLRQDLGTLVNSLERSGYRAEAFTPRADGTLAAASTQTGFQNGRQDSESEPGCRGGSQDASQNSNSGGGQQQQQRRDSRPAKWIEELENQQ